MPFDSDIEPWERQPGEKAASFALFAEFRDLGPTRSYNQFIRDKRRSRSGLFNLAAAHGWNDRLDAYDRHVDRRVQQANIDEINAMANRHARVALGMLGKATEALNAVDASKLTPTQLVAFVETAVKVERLARGEPTEIAEEVSEADHRVLIDDPETAAAARELLRLVARPGQPGGAGARSDEG